MKPPREAGTGRGQAGGLARSLTESTASGAACFSVSLKTPKKPLKPISTPAASEFLPSGTVFEYTASVWGLSRNTSPKTPPKTRGLLFTYSRTTQAQNENPAPSAPKPLTLPQRVEASSPEVLGGNGSTPTLTPFSPSPRVEYQTLCAQLAGLEAYLEREAPEMRARGEHDALGELEKIAGAMLDRISELHASGAHLGSAGRGDV